MLSLSEFPVSEGQPGSIRGWGREREDLLTSVESLRGLITHMQIKVEENEGLAVIVVVIILCLCVYLRALCAPADIGQ